MNNKHYCQYDSYLIIIYIVKFFKLSVAFLGYIFLALLGFWCLYIGYPYSWQLANWEIKSCVGLGVWEYLRVSRSFFK